MQEIKNDNMPAVEAKEAVIAGAANRSVAVPIIRFIALLSVAIFAPAINVQAVTGTLVNATLFISAALLGIPAALLIGIIPSMASSALGVLSPALVTVVPFIIISNAVLVLIFASLRKRSYWTGAIAAGLVKFGILSLVSTFVIGYFVPVQAASQLALMMSYPQLYTAFSGALLAYIVLGTMKKTER